MNYNLSMRLFLKFICLLILFSSIYSCDSWIDEKGNEYRSGYWGPDVSEFIFYTVILFLVGFGFLFLIKKKNLSKRNISIVLTLILLLLAIIWIIYFHLNLHSC